MLPGKVRADLSLFQVFRDLVVTRYTMKFSPRLTQLNPSQVDGNHGKSQGGSLLPNP